MMPQEWPIAPPETGRKAPARAPGRGRLSTVRVDFFLNPSERLTEQERALMTAMLNCLVRDIAIEIRAALPAGWAGANDDEARIVTRLTRAGLLDSAELMALLLRRADEERIATAARARGGRRDARALQGLVSHENGAVSAAAMALVLARGRRRDRFGQALVSLDDLSLETADHLCHAVAASMRRDLAAAHGYAVVDRELSNAATQFVARHDPCRSIDALTDALIDLLDGAGALSDPLLLACAQEGEVGFLADVVARLAGLARDVAFGELLSATPQRLMTLIRLAGLSREVTVGLLAGVGDLLGVDDPGAAIDLFDRLTSEDVKAASVSLAASPAYRAALEALGRPNG